MPEINDDAVLERAIQGDSEAFGALYERYVGRIYNYIYYRTGNVYDAEPVHILLTRQKHELKARQALIEHSVPVPCTVTGADHDQIR